MPFLSLVTMTFKLVRARQQTRLPREFGANRLNGSQDISHAERRRQKQNLEQLGECSKTTLQFHTGVGYCGRVVTPAAR